MTAILSLLRIVPRWCWAILLLPGLLLGAELHGRQAVHKQWDADRVQQSALLAVASHASINVLSPSKLATHNVWDELSRHQMSFVEWLEQVDMPAFYGAV